MHPFIVRYPTDGSNDVYLPPYRRRYLSADDVIAVWERDRTAHPSRMDSWHLAPDGRHVCCDRLFDMPDLAVLAEDPYPLTRCREADDRQDCPGNWFLYAQYEAGFEVNEGHVETFVELRDAVSMLDITLLDVIVVSGFERWWSLHELTSGTTEWTFDMAPITAQGAWERQRARDRARRAARTAARKAKQAERLQKVMEDDVV
jgi:hypothetical protein